MAKAALHLRKFHLICAIVVTTALALHEEETSGISSSPVGKIVRMLDIMQNQIQDESKHEADSYDKFMCYCKASSGDLAKSISEAEAQAPLFKSNLWEKDNKKVLVDASIKSHEAAISAAKSALKEAAAKRDKDSAASNKARSESEARIQALSKAVSAVESGAVNGFLCTGDADMLKKFVGNKDDMLESDRQDVLAFLSGGEGKDQLGQPWPAPENGDIVATLKALKDQVKESSFKAQTAEDVAIENYRDFVAAKKEEIAAQSKAREEQQESSKKLEAEIAQINMDVSDMQDQLSTDKEFLADLSKNCDTENKEWEGRQQIRSQELFALSESMKALTDDGSIDLFRKTLPRLSLLQGTMNRAAIKKRALALVDGLKGSRNSNLKSPAELVRRSYRTQIGLISLALRESSSSHETVIKLIDATVASILESQKNDHRDNDYCTKQMKALADEKTGDVGKADDALSQQDAWLAEKVKDLTNRMGSLGDWVKEATNERKAAHSDFLQLMESNSAAKDALQSAISRLSKFYDSARLPAQSADEEPTEDDDSSSSDDTTDDASPSFLQESSKKRAKRADIEALPPAPAALETYAKKAAESRGVMNMLQLLMEELEQHAADAQKSENDAESDYQQMLEDAAESRATDAKSLSTMQEELGTVASTETDDDDQSSSTESDDVDQMPKANESAAVDKYAASIHGSCDLQLKYFDVRRDARKGEIEALEEAKALMTGGVSLLQRKRHGHKRHLRRRAPA